MDRLTWLMEDPQELEEEAFCNCSNIHNVPRVQAPALSLRWSMSPWTDNPSGLFPGLQEALCMVSARDHFLSHSGQIKL